MNRLYDPETAPLIFKHSVPAPTRDKRESREKQLAVYMILASTLFERIAFYSIAANLIISLGPNTPFNWKASHASTAILIFTGTSYISTFIFAIISDGKLGRFKTILLGFLLYLIGYILAITVTSPFQEGHICNISASHIRHPAKFVFDEQCAEWILPILIIIAFGAGAIQSNIPIFGAEQIQDLNLIPQYFDKHVIIINISAILAKLIIPLIQTKPHQYYIEYVFAASAILMAAIIFILGRRYYLHVNTNETVITKCIPVWINAFQSWYRYTKTKRSVDLELTTSAASNLPISSHILLKEKRSLVEEKRPSTFLDFAKAINHGKFHDRIVNDVKSLRTTLIVFILLIPYWLIYNQLDSTFPAQRQNMRKPVQISNMNVFVNSISFGDPIIIIVGILIFNKYLYKYLGSRTETESITAKFIIGMCLASFAMSISGLVESIREFQCDDIVIFDATDSDLYIYYQIPQNIFMGFSEFFMMVASFEYAYFAAPCSAQTLFMSLRFCAIGIASFIGAACSFVLFQSPSKPNFDCQQNQVPNFYIYFYILASIQLLFIMLILLCQKKCHIIRFNPQQMEKNQILFHHSASFSS